MNILDKLTKKPNTTTTPAVEPESKSGEKKFVDGLVSTKDIIAPASLEVDFDHIRIDNKYYRTLFVAGYPRFVGINWLSSLINFDASLNISMYVYPTDGKAILDDLRRKVTEMEAEISTDIQRGRVVNPATQAKLEDALNLQADLVKGEERFFQFGLYVTITADSVEELNKTNKNIEAALGALLIVSKKATLQMEDGFVTTLPVCLDKLNISRNMDTTSLATTFPFVSSDLSDDKGIMYGINIHNASLVIFDRFSMPNYNSVVFATAGAGKSYMIKLEAMRSLMMGTEIIVIDPENEYRDLCEAVGGQYIAFGYGESSKINPFDLSLIQEEEENALNAKILSLHKLLKIMLGALDPIEESIMDRAMMDAYKMKGITPDPESQKKEPPLIEDMYKALIGMEDPKAAGIAARLEKYIKGSFAGIFNQKTTVNLNNKFVVFGIKNLEESLRPVAMHIVLDYIWTTVKNNLKKRILVVDEAWYMMQYPDSAEFLRGIVKRGRKYYLGVTTITQDVDDFLKTTYGKEIVTNSSIQILLKQHSAAIDQVGEVFYLSEGEKQLLLSADKGEGIFFAGQNHVAIKVIASEDEHELITSNPEEVMKKQIPGQKPPTPSAPIISPVQNTPSAPINQVTPSTTIAQPAPTIQTSPTYPKDPIKTEVIKPTGIPPQPKPTVNNLPPIPTPVLNPKPMVNNLQPTSSPIISPKPVIDDVQNTPLKEVVAPIKQENPTEVLQRKINDLEKIEKNEPSNKPFVGFKAEVVENNPVKTPALNKPVFLSPEKKIPQPPQLAGAVKPKPEFVKPTTEPIKTEPAINTDNGGDNKPKMDYDKLFGNGIV